MTPARRSLLYSVTIIAIAMVVWVATHQPVPQPTGSDLYEQLSVASHLIKGEGFLCDIAYPLSYSFDAGASVPQPLLHRPAGYSLLLTLPVAAARGDPDTALDWTRVLHLMLLAAILAMGLVAVRHVGGWISAVTFTAILITNPLLDMSIRWLQVESAAALTLLGLWMILGRRNDGKSRSDAVVIGLLAGMTALLRMELLWLPWLWIIVTRRGAGRSWFVVTFIVWLAVLAPWLLRNAVVTGDPLFSIQAYAEQLKDTPGNEGLTPYLTLEGEHWTRTLVRDPGTILQKTGNGLIYQAARLDNWVPWLLFPVILAMVLLARLRGQNVLGAEHWRRPTLVLTSWLMMSLLYAPLSHDLRHMTPLAPIALLELWLLMNVIGMRLVHRTPLARWAPAAIGLACLVFGPRMPGWESARETAVREHESTAAMLDAIEYGAAETLICDQAAVFWFGDRRGMVTPIDESTLHKIQQRVPALREAQIISKRLKGSGDSQTR